MCQLDCLVHVQNEVASQLQSSLAAVFKNVDAEPWKQVSQLQTDAVQAVTAYVDKKLAGKLDSITRAYSMDSIDDRTCHQGDECVDRTSAALFLKPRF